MSRGTAAAWAIALALTTVATVFVLGDVLVDVHKVREEMLWCVVAVPLAGAIWFGRQGILPDRHRDISWRVRNGAGCAALAAGVTTIFVMSYVPSLLPGMPWGTFDMTWGISTGFDVGLPALGVGLITLVWGVVDWSRSARTRRLSPPTRLERSQ